MISIFFFPLPIFFPQPSLGKSKNKNEKQSQKKYMLLWYIKRIFLFLFYPRVFIRNTLLYFVLFVYLEWWCWWWLCLFLPRYNASNKYSDSIYSASVYFYFVIKSLKIQAQKSLSRIFLSTYRYIYIHTYYYFYAWSVWIYSVGKYFSSLACSMRLKLKSIQICFLFHGLSIKSTTYTYIYLLPTFFYYIHLVV